MLKFFFFSKFPGLLWRHSVWKKLFNKFAFASNALFFNFFPECNGAKGTLVTKRYSKKILIFFFTLWYLIVQFFFQIFDYRGDPKKILIELGPPMFKWGFGRWYGHLGSTMYARTASHIYLNTSKAMKVVPNHMKTFWSHSYLLQRTQKSLIWSSKILQYHSSITQV